MAARGRARDIRSRRRPVYLARYKGDTPAPPPGKPLCVRASRSAACKRVVLPREPPWTCFAGESEGGAVPESRNVGRRRRREDLRVHYVVRYLGSQQRSHVRLRRGHMGSDSSASLSLSLSPFSAPLPPSLSLNAVLLWFPPELQEG